MGGLQLLGCPGWNPYTLHGRQDLYLSQGWYKSQTVIPFTITTPWVRKKRGLWFIYLKIPDSQSKNIVCALQITFRVLLLTFEWKFLKRLADDQCSSIIEGNTYYIKHMSKKPFSMEVDWLQSWCSMKVSTMFHICTYCIFTLWGRYAKMSGR